MEPPIIVARLSLRRVAGLVQEAGRARRLRRRRLRRRRRAVLDELAWAAPGSAAVARQLCAADNQALLSLKYDVSLERRLATRPEARLLGDWYGRVGGLVEHERRLAKPRTQKVVTFEPLKKAR